METKGNKMKSNTLLICGKGNPFGMLLVFGRVINQQKSRQHWRWERANDGKRFCILPHKKWMFS